MKVYVVHTRRTECGVVRTRRWTSTALDLLLKIIEARGWTMVAIELKDVD